MATTWGKPSLSMVARAAFLRSRKNATCSSGLSRICCRRSVAIRACLLSRAHQPAPLSILSSNGQVSRQEALGLVEALLRRILGIAGVGAHGKAVAGGGIRFDSPARALDCARAAREAVRRLGIDIRVGIHTGECELQGRSLTGMAGDVR